MKKAFDCVEMKNAIQRELLQKYEGMSTADMDEARRQDLLNDPEMGPLVRQMKLHRVSAARQQASRAGKAD